MNPPSGFEVDHIDRNIFNNTRKNLRICTHADNMLNRKMFSNNKSGAKGVYKAKRRNGKIYYRSEISFRGKKIRGSFKDIPSAKEWYAKKAKELHGEFANLN